MANTDGIPAGIQDDGLLWLINRAVFHPRGFALAHDAESHEFSLLGDGSEAWRFDPDIEDDLFDKVEALFARARAAD